MPGSGNPETKRTQGAMTIAGVQVPSMYECADGFVMISVALRPGVRADDAAAGEVGG